MIKNKKNICGHRTWFWLAILFVGAFYFIPENIVSAGLNQTIKMVPAIKIIYPKENQRIAVVDSTFILGSVTPGAQLTINGVPIEVYHTGGFLAWLAIDTGQFIFRLVAVSGEQETTLDWPVTVGLPEFFIPDTGLIILPATIGPGNFQVLQSGDYLEVSFRGTPGCSASFRIEGLEGEYPMTEPERRLPISRGGGGDVFGDEETGFLPPGLYTGGWLVPGGLTLDSAKVIVQLSRDVLTIPGGEDSLTGITDSTISRMIVDQSPGWLSVNDGQVPRVVELTDSVQTLRFGPRWGYLTIFQPRGVRAVYAGENGGWVRLRLAPGYSAWVEKRKTNLLPAGTPVPGGLISYLRTRSRESWTEVSLDLSTRLPFKVEEDPEQLRLQLSIFGATTNTDWVRYDPQDDLIERITWNQSQPGVYELTVFLRRGPLWGYEVDYRNGRLVFAIRRPPDLLRGLRGLTICVDPGHGLDSGAIGPTGLTEKEANLALARELRRELESVGARVIMTRTADVQVDLYARPVIASQGEADIFISLHNNAVPDGINPYFHHGTSSYYYHRHSQDLARAIQPRLLNATRLPDYGLYHANFAVLRPTQYPSVLVECAFMILPDQEELLRQEKFQRRIAREIRRGLEDFINHARRDYYHR